jgi:hypothetical protein
MEEVSESIAIALELSNRNGVQVRRGRASGTASSFLALSSEISAPRRTAANPLAQYRPKSMPFYSHCPTP